jgi:putative peptidoglycan lipid II flippase
VNLKKTTLSLSIINAASAFLGFLFHIMLGRRFGISWELDCLFVSLTIFSFLGIFNALLITLLTPVFNEIKNRDEKEGFEFADVVFKWSLFIGLVIWFVIVNFDSLIIKLFASGFDEKSLILSKEIVQILFIGFIFSTLAASVTVILNALYFFLIPALMGLLSPLLNIAAIFVLTPQYGVKGIAFSYMFFNTFQAIVLLLYIFAKTPWRPTLKIYHHKILDLLKHSSTAVTGNFIWSLRDIISRNIASNLGSGAITLMSYADKIISVPTQIITAPFSGVFYAKASQLIAIPRWNEVKDLLSRVTRVTSSISIFVSAGIILFIKPLLNLLFLGSRFTESDIYILSYLMIIELIYLIVISYELIFVRVAYAAKKPIIVLGNSILGVALFYVLSINLPKLLGLYGLALSISLTQVPICILYFYFINKYMNAQVRSILYPLLKNLVFASVFVIAGLFVNNSLKSDMLMIFLWAPAWAALYLGISRYVLKDEWNILRTREA